MGAGGKLVSSLVAVDDDGNVSTPGTISAGGATISGIEPVPNVEMVTIRPFSAPADPSTDQSVGLYATWFRALAKGSVVIRYRKGFGLGFNLVGEDLITISAQDGRVQVGGTAALHDTDLTGATLQVAGTAGGFLPPRLTTAQRDAIAPGGGAPLAGVMCWNTDNSRLEVYDGAGWVAV